MVSYFSLLAFHFGLMNPKKMIQPPVKMNQTIPKGPLV